MTVRPKATKLPYVQMDVEEVINRGGKTVGEGVPTRSIRDVNFCLRLSAKLVDGIDADRKTKPGKVSRNQWITEAIDEKLRQSDTNKVSW